MPRQLTSPFGDIPAWPYSGIVALCGNIGQTIVDDDLDLDVGIIRQKTLNWPENRVRCATKRSPPTARSTVAEAIKALQWAGVLTWQNRITRILVRERDLLGQGVAGG